MSDRNPTYTELGRMLEEERGHHAHVVANMDEAIMKERENHEQFVTNMDEFIMQEREDHEQVVAIITEERDDETEDLKDKMNALKGELQDRNEVLEASGAKVTKLSSEVRHLRSIAEAIDKLPPRAKRARDISIGVES